MTNLCGIAKVLTPKQYDLDEWRPNEATLDGVPVYPNLTVNNGVIHIIDNLLGYIYNDAYEMIKEDEDIRYCIQNHRLPYLLTTMMVG